MRAGAKYEVWFDYACDDQWKGNTIVVSAENDSGDSSTFTARLPTTRTLDDYQQTKLGVLELTPGKHRLVLRSAGPITGRLMDLRGIRLAPVN